ncbi:MAG: hypothetical protein ABFS35_10395 [Bacteroidota bacterium]
MKILSEYIEEHKLLLNKWIGRWSMEEYKKAFQTFKHMNETNNIKNIIQDISNLEFNIDHVELVNDLVQIRKEIKNKNFNVVYITGKPQDIVFSHLYAKALQNEHSYKYCTTAKSAIEILSLNMSLHDLENRLSKLNK